MDSYDRLSLFSLSLSLLLSLSSPARWFVFHCVPFCGKGDFPTQDPKAIHVSLRIKGQTLDDLCMCARIRVCVCERVRERESENEQYVMKERESTGSLM